MGDDTTLADGSASLQEDWATGLTDTIISYIDTARRLGTDNMVRVLRVLVYGLIAMMFGIASVIFTVVISVRMADAYLPIGSGVGDATWAAHLLIGSLLSILGAGLWASRKSAGMRNFGLAVAVDGIILIVLVLVGFTGG